MFGNKKEMFGIVRQANMVQIAYPSRRNEKEKRKHKNNELPNRFHTCKVTNL